METEFGRLIVKRRTYYKMKKGSPISDQAIEEIIKQAIKYSPTAYNSQQTRAVLLLSGAHEKFWSITMDAIRRVTGKPLEELQSTQRKLDSFKGGYGTVLFYNDTSVTKQFEQKFPSYKNNFENWAEQSNAILQFSVWNMLEEAGFAAALQHYNPIVDTDVRHEWKIDPHWKLIAQMPFGMPIEQPGPQEFNPIDERFRLIET